MVFGLEQDWVVHCFYYGHNVNASGDHQSFYRYPHPVTLCWALFICLLFRFFVFAMFRVLCRFLFLDVAFN